MEIVNLTKEKYKEWDNFCLESDDAWFWHTTDWLNYTVYYRPELKTQNISFLVYKEGKIKAVCTLMLESYNNAGGDFFEFSFGGSALPAPALANDILSMSGDRLERDMILELIFLEIDRIARVHKIKRIRLKDAPLSNSFLSKRQPFNYFMKYDGYIDVSLNTRLIDLSKTKEELWNGMRRNHKRNIKKESAFKTKVYTAENITYEIFLSYKNMHHKAAGRKTRPEITFELMHKWLKANLAFLVVVEFNRVLIGFEYYSIYKNNVYGFSAANDPDYEGGHSIRHLLEWEAICYMKSQKYCFYEIGLQQFGATFFDFPDKKQLDITHFKKGFGGFVAPYFMAEKYYDKDYFLDEQRERIKKYAELNFKTQ